MANIVILTGRLGQDPEAKTTTSGVILANFSVATSGRRKDGDTWVEDTQWHRCTAFGKTAEFLVKYGSKGREVFVRGTLKYRTYQKDGVDKTAAEITVDELNLLGPKPPTGGDASTGEPDPDIPF